MSLSLLQNARRIVAITLIGIAATATAAQPQTDSRGLPTLAPLVNAVTPAVVNISVITRSPHGRQPAVPRPVLPALLQPARPAAARASRPPAPASSSTPRSGYVLTNHHVIKDAEQVIVTLKDRRQFQAKLVGTDPGTDIAVLQIDGAEPHGAQVRRFRRSCRSAIS